MDLSVFVPYEEFRRLCLLTIMLHDSGKPGDEFQKMLWKLERVWENCIQKGCSAKQVKAILNENRYQQVIRHELAGLMFLTTTKPMKWLQEQAGVHFKEVLGGIYGHHLKTEKQIPDLATLNETTIHVPAQPVIDMTRELIHEFQLPFTPLLDASDLRINGGRNWDILNSTAEGIIHQEHGTAGWWPETRLSMAIKFITVMADTFGSMSPSKGWANQGYSGFEDWLFGYIRKGLAPKTIRLKGHISPRARKNPYFHQEQALALRGSALFGIGCGLGKSAAALMALSDGPDYTSTKRAVISAPVRTAIIQQYKDNATYQKHAERKIKRGTQLRTSTSETDQRLLELVRFGQADPDDNDIKSLQGILDTLCKYSDGIVYATTDQILGSVALRRSSILWLPFITKARINFDEFHAYDPVMESNLHRFLEVFPNLDVVATSATITESQEKAFLQGRPDAEIILSSGKAEVLAKAPRYRFHFIEESEAASYFSTEHKTLWIVNRVHVSQETGKDFPDSIALHSRYRRREALLLQEKLVNAFRSKRTKIRAVTTQIAQMSIDISAGRMITEICPINEFIQRLGRAAFRGEDPNGVLTDVYMYMPDSNRPYHENLGALLPWFKGLLQQEAWSLYDLVAYFQQSAKEPNTSDKNLIPRERGMMSSMPTRTRQTDGKISAILAQDLPEIESRLEHHENPRLVQEYEFAIFPPKNVDTLPEFRHRVVVAYDYDERLGVLIPLKGSR